MAKSMDTISDVKDIPVQLLEASSALAENLVQSEPFLRFKAAENTLNADPEALQLLKEFSELQQKLRNQQLSSVIEESDIQRLRELQSKISTNETIQNYGLAQELAVAFLREVNQEISQLLGIDFASLTRRSGGCC